MPKNKGFCPVNSALFLSIFLFACGSPSSPPVQPTLSPQSISGSQTKASLEEKWDNIIAAARKEGKLTIYSTPSGEVIRGLATAFKAKYGIEIEYINGRGEELAQRMLTERNAGLYVVDVVMSGDATLITVMKPQQLLGSLAPLLILPEVLEPKAWAKGDLPYADKDRTSIEMVANFQRYIMRNRELVKDGEINSYKDLLNPKWKANIAFNDPTITGTANGFLTMLASDVFGLEGTKDFMRQFIKQEPAITRDRRLQAEWVARGKYSLGAAVNMENVAEFVTLGAPVDLVKVVEGSKIAPGAACLAIPTKSPHPNATQLYVNWLLSKEGHAVFVKVYGNVGSRVDAPKEGIPSMFFPEPGEKVYYDTEEKILLRAEMTRISKEIFAPILK